MIWDLLYNLFALLRSEPWWIECQIQTLLRFVLAHELYLDHQF